MTSRRDFLTRSGLALGALIVGDEMLDALDRLTHVRKSFPSVDLRHRNHSLPPVQWRYVRVTGDGGPTVSLQRKTDPNGGWTDIETTALVNSVAMFKHPYWRSATVVIGTQL